MGLCGITEHKNHLYDILYLNFQKSVLLRNNITDFQKEL